MKRVYIRACAILVATVAGSAIYAPPSWAGESVDNILGAVVAADRTVAEDLGKRFPQETISLRSGLPRMANYFGPGSTISIPTGGQQQTRTTTTTTGAEVVSNPSEEDSVETVVVPRDGGTSIQYFTIIDKSSDPSEFSFVFEGFDLDVGVDGLVATANNGDEWRLAPAWAKDANGRAVPSRFELRGETLVQVVDHTKADYAYPIVADPFLGRHLFKNLSQDTWKGDRVYNGDLTAFGWVIYTGAGYVPGLPAGQYVINNHGWAEWVARWPAITNKPTLRQQFSCHALGALAAGTWNLERARKNQPSWHSWFSKRCNW